MYFADSIPLFCGRLATFSVGVSQVTHTHTSSGYTPAFLKLWPNLFSLNLWWAIHWLQPGIETTTLSILPVQLIKLLIPWLLRSFTWNLENFLQQMMAISMLKHLKPCIVGLVIYLQLVKADQSSKSQPRHIEKWSSHESKCSVGLWALNAARDGRKTLVNIPLFHRLSTIPNCWCRISSNRVHECMYTCPLYIYMYIYIYIHK